MGESHAAPLVGDPPLAVVVEERILRQPMVKMSCYFAIEPEISIPKLPDSFPVMDEDEMDLKIGAEGNVDEHEK